MSESKVLSQDFIEFVNLLNSRKVEYLLTGGYAVAYYGYPRYTGDIYFWINDTTENARKVMEVLKAFDLPIDNIEEKEFTKPEQILQIGYPPYRIDIITSIDGVVFTDAVKNAKKVEFGGIKVNMISLDDLKKNKRASGRTKDFNDLENLT